MQYQNKFNEDVKYKKQQYFWVLFLRVVFCSHLVGTYFWEFYILKEHVDIYFYEFQVSKKLYVNKISLDANKRKAI